MTETIETLRGGITLDVTKLDGSTESVLVRDLPLGEMPKYLEVLEDESRQAELFCAKDKGWAEGLSRESLESVISLGEERNLDFLVRFSQRISRRRERIFPGVATEIAQAIASKFAATSQGSPV